VALPRILAHIAEGAAGGVMAGLCTAAGACRTYTVRAACLPCGVPHPARRGHGRLGCGAHAGGHGRATLRVLGIPGSLLPPGCRGRTRWATIAAPARNAGPRRGVESDRRPWRGLGGDAGGSPPRRPTPARSVSGRGVRRQPARRRATTRTSLSAPAPARRARGPAASQASSPSFRTGLPTFGTETYWAAEYEELSGSSSRSTRGHDPSGPGSELRRRRLATARTSLGRERTR
jgi:hypothetical protein